MQKPAKASKRKQVGLTDLPTSRAKSTEASGTFRSSVQIERWRASSMPVRSWDYSSARTCKDNRPK